MTAPIRIQRMRTKGWHAPLNTIYVGRPTKWGNLWRVGLVACSCRSVGECSHNRFRCETAAEAVAAYRAWIEGGNNLRHMLSELRGENLSCWCPLVDKDGNPIPCHADVLLELANR